jgi:hypothetical protein
MTLTAVRNKEDEVDLVTTSCWKQMMKTCAIRAAHERDYQGESDSSSFHFNQRHL